MPTSAPATTKIDQDLVETFQRDGVVLLRNILGAYQVDVLAAGVERNLRDLSQLGMNATKPGQPGAFVEDFRNWQRIPEYAEAVGSSVLPEAAGALMRSRTVRLFHDHVLVKEAGTRDRSPWHQDQPYYTSIAVSVVCDCAFRDPAGKLIRIRELR